LTTSAVTSRVPTIMLVQSLVAVTLVTFALASPEIATYNTVRLLHDRAVFFRILI